MERRILSRRLRFDDGRLHERRSTFRLSRSWCRPLTERVLGGEPIAVCRRSLATSGGGWRFRLLTETQPSSCWDIFLLVLFE
jgi:hypothetical protein